MKKYLSPSLFTLLCLGVVSILQIGCASNESGAGLNEGFSAPAPSRPIDRTTELQNEFSSFNNSQFF